MKFTALFCRSREQVVLTHLGRTVLFCRVFGSQELFGFQQELHWELKV